MNVFFVLKLWLQAKLARDEQGANLVEYLLLVALIVLAAVGAIAFLRTTIIDVLYKPSGSTLSQV